MPPGQQVRAFVLVLVARQVPGRALLLGGQLGFELLDPGLERGNGIARRQAAWGPYGQRFLLQLVKINSNQGLPILVVRARQAVALDDGARAFGRDVEAGANLHVGELFEHPPSHHPSGWAPYFNARECSAGPRQATVHMVDERLTRSRGGSLCGANDRKPGVDQRAALSGLAKAIQADESQNQVFELNVTCLVEMAGDHHTIENY